MTDSNLEKDIRTHNELSSNSENTDDLRADLLPKFHTLFHDQDLAAFVHSICNSQFPSVVIADAEEKDVLLALDDLLALDELLIADELKLIINYHLDKNSEDESICLILADKIIYETFYYRCQDVVRSQMNSVEKSHLPATLLVLPQFLRDYDHLDSLIELRNSL